MIELNFMRIIPDSELNPRQEKTLQRYSSQVVDGFDEKVLGELLEIERVSFPENMQSDEQDMRELLADPQTLTVIVRDENQGTQGYVCGVPSKESYRYLKEFDSEFTPQEHTMYMESIAFKPEHRGLEGLLEGTGTFFQAAKSRGFDRLSMHARVSNKLSEVLQKRYGAKFKRRMENWHGFEEPFDYLEMEIS